MTETIRKCISEREAVEQAIREVLSDSARLKARDENESQFFQIRAAKLLGYEEPFSAEQRAMNTILTSLDAGNTCCEKAWRLFHELTAAPIDATELRDAMISVA